MKYLLDSAINMGFDVTKGSCLSTLEPMTVREYERLSREMKKSAKRFYQGLTRRGQRPPTLFHLMLFRMTRTGLKDMEGLELRDYYYYRDKGWFESDYYYDTSLGWPKKAMGKFFDVVGQQMSKRMTRGR